MNTAAQARANRIAEMMRSARAKLGPFSIYSRIKEAAIGPYAAHLAGVYANEPPTPEELTRSMNLWLGSQPQCFYTAAEVAQQGRQRLHNEHGTKRVIHDITPGVLRSLNPVETLALCNEGKLPDRFQLKIYSNDET